MYIQKQLIFPQKTQHVLIIWPLYNTLACAPTYLEMISTAQNYNMANRKYGK